MNKPNEVSEILKLVQDRLNTLSDYSMEKSEEYHKLSSELISLCDVGIDAFGNIPVTLVMDKLQESMTRMHNISMRFTEAIKNDKR